MNKHTYGAFRHYRNTTNEKNKHYKNMKTCGRRDSWLEVNNQLIDQ